MSDLTVSRQATRRKRKRRQAERRKRWTRPSWCWRCALRYSMLHATWQRIPPHLA